MSYVIIALLIITLVFAFRSNEKDQKTMTDEEKEIMQRW